MATTLQLIHHLLPPACNRLTEQVDPLKRCRCKRPRRPLDPLVRSATLLSDQELKDLYYESDYTVVDTLIVARAGAPRAAAEFVASRFQPVFGSPDPDPSPVSLTARLHRRKNPAYVPGRRDSLPLPAPSDVFGESEGLGGRVDCLAPVRTWGIPTLPTARALTGGHQELAQRRTVLHRKCARL
jgi:hypothetical protein